MCSKKSLDFFFFKPVIYLLFITLFAIFWAPSGFAGAESDFYYQIELDAAINPVTVNYFERALDLAVSEGASGLIIRLDTPGGLLDSTSEMISRILNTEIPVIVWIGPSGARAASAGVFISYAAHVSSMATGTRLGAAHPVAGLGGDLEGKSQEKVVEDAVAQLQGLARQRQRSQSYGENFIRNNLTIGEEEALANRVVEFKADSVEQLKQKLAGLTVELNSESLVSLPESAELIVLERTWREHFLGILLNPNLVYIFLMLGIYGLIIEFSNPGLELGIVVGGIFLLLALYGLNILPLNYAGLGLLLLGVILMVLEIFITSYGVLTVGGLFSFILGSVMLFDTEAFRISPGLIAGVGLATLAFFLLAGYLVASSWWKPVKIGRNSISGKTGVVKSRLDPVGKVYVWGEYWTAESVSGETIEQGETVEVVKEKRQKLFVKTLKIEKELG